MYEIKSFVFFDIETTGLPWQERNRTKITELSFVAVSRENMFITPQGDSHSPFLPPVSKLTLVFNPCKTIDPVAAEMTGLTNDLLKFAPPFGRKIETLLTFLQDLPKPVCLVAHNGDRFDYRILLAEFADANASLPNDLLCVDSLTGFKYILKSENQYNTPKPKVQSSLRQKREPATDLLTDDEDEWPDLNASTEDWEDIDNLCNSLSDVSCEEISEEPKVTETSIEVTHKVNKKKAYNKRSEIIEKVFSKEKKSAPFSNGYTLVDLYKRLLHFEPVNSHRAEGDCLMLLQCVAATKDAFIPWADSACKKVIEIQPLVRY